MGVAAPYRRCLWILCTQYFYEFYNSPTIKPDTPGTSVTLPPLWPIVQRFLWELPHPTDDVCEFCVHTNFREFCSSHTNKPDASGASVTLPSTTTTDSSSISMAVAVPSRRCLVMFEPPHGRGAAKRPWASNTRSFTSHYQHHPNNDFEDTVRANRPISYSLVLKRIILVRWLD